MRWLDWLFKPYQKVRVSPYRRELLLLDCQIHGSHYYDCLSLLSQDKLSVGQPLILRRQPDNAYDENAIEILTQRGVKLGYVPQKDNTVIANLLDQHCSLSTHIDSIVKTAWEPIGIRIILVLES